MFETKWTEKHQRIYNTVMNDVNFNECKHSEFISKAVDSYLRWFTEKELDDFGINPDNSGLEKEKWLYCIDCDTVFDMYKYDNIEDTGHSECNLRKLTQKEKLEAYKECKEEGCFKEVRL